MRGSAPAWPNSHTNRAFTLPGSIWPGRRQTICEESLARTLRDPDQETDGAAARPLRHISRWSITDGIAGALGLFATMAILMNALFMQSGSHPAPIFPAPGGSVAIAAAPPAAQKIASAHLPGPPFPPPARATATAPQLSAPSIPAPPRPVVAGASANARAGVPTASPPDRPQPSRRISALQRALSEYGYGPVRPTGVMDADTQAAIQKFERERKLPVTGVPSDRVARELVLVTGRALD